LKKQGDLSSKGRKRSCFSHKVLFGCLFDSHQAWDPRFDQSQSDFASGSVYQ